MRPLIAVMSSLTLLVLIGLVARVRRGGVDTGSLVFLLLAPVTVYLTWLRYALFVDRWANLQGRLFLCVAAVVGIVWVLGLDGLATSDRARKIGAAVGFAFMLLANVGVIACAVTLYRS
jgi:ABC-type uncharacterized transport system permease subunit